MADAIPKPKRELRANGPPIQARHSEATSNTIKLAYLAVYNLVSAILWGIILCRVVSIALFWGNAELNRTTGSFVRWVQSLALLEIGHSAFGLVRAPIFTTITQVASRMALIHLIYPVFPDLPATHWQNSTMLFAWSATETIRYTYFFGLLGGLDELGGLPSWLKWLRYNTFFVLYPIGIYSECYLIFKAMAPSSEMKGMFAPREEREGGGTELGEGSLLTGLLGLILGMYVPGSVILYVHMIGQRNKVMKKEREKAKGGEVKKTQ